MKFRLTFKTPDVLTDAIEGEINSFFPPEDFTHEELVEYDNMDDENDKIEFIRETVKNRAEFIEKFVKYGEYISVDFDSKTQTATVVKL